jgi:hypothetical protein
MVPFLLSIHQFLKNEPKAKKNIRNEKKYILIVCEGQTTEKYYFEDCKIDLKLTTTKIKVLGTGRNTLSLVEYALKQRKKQGLDLENDEVWCVFDRDDFQIKGNFDNAIKKANANNLKIAYSNECFELWYILHFEYLNTDIGRTQYSPKLDQLLGMNYEKNTAKMYDKLKDKQNTAIKFAKKLLTCKEYNSLPDSQKCPSTSVHLLVQSLNLLQK